MIHGNARVSIDARDLTNQVAQHEAAGCAKIFHEKITGATVEHPEPIEAGESQRSVARNYNVSPAIISRHAL